MHGIIIDDKHSYNDFNAVMTAREISYPQQIKITETVPYSNIVYDFSYIYGDKMYSERTLHYELSIALAGVKNREKLNFFANEIVNWLQSYCGKTKVIDTYLPQYYFLAECLNAPHLSSIEIGEKLQTVSEIAKEAQENARRQQENMYTAANDIAVKVGANVLNSANQSTRQAVEEVVTNADLMYAKSNDVNEKMTVLTQEINLKFAAVGAAIDGILTRLATIEGA